MLPCFCFLLSLSKWKWPWVYSGSCVRCRCQAVAFYQVHIDSTSCNHETPLTLTGASFDIKVSVKGTWYMAAISCSTVFVTKTYRKDTDDGSSYRQGISLSQTYRQTEVDKSYYDLIKGNKNLAEENIWS